MGARLDRNLPDGSLSWLAVVLTVDWVSTGVPDQGLRIPCPMWPPHVPWVSPNMVAIPRGRKQKLPDLLGPGLRSIQLFKAISLSLMDKENKLYFSMRG